MKNKSKILMMIVVIALQIPIVISTPSVKAQPKQVVCAPIADDHISNIERLTECSFGYSIAYNKADWTPWLSLNNYGERPTNVILRQLSLQNVQGKLTPSVHIAIWGNPQHLDVEAWLVQNLAWRLASPSKLDTASHRAIAGYASVELYEPNTSSLSSWSTLFTYGDFIYQVRYDGKSDEKDKSVYYSVLDSWQSEPISESRTWKPNIPSSPPVKTPNTSTCCGFTDQYYNPFPCDTPTGECTWYAQYRWTNTGPQPRPHALYPGVYGNAYLWYPQAISAGYSVGTSPANDAIAILQPYVQGAYGNGHVAYVTSISGNNFNVDQMNWGACYNTHTFSVDGSPNPTSGYPNVSFIYGTGGSNATPTPTQPAGNPPNPPVLDSPGDWAVSHDGNAPNLCWHDGGGASEYYVQVTGAVNATRDWNSSTCWTPTDLNGRSYGYAWQVKARNSYGESGWSSQWHFNIACDPDDSHIALYDQTNYQENGRCVVLGTGDYPNPGYLGAVGNDNTKSIRVGNQVQATLYQDDNYGGSSQTFTSSNPDLSGSSVGYGTSSVRVQVRQAQATNTPTSNVVSLDYVNTADGNGNITTVFNAGDVIQERIGFTNRDSQAHDVTFSWDVYDSNYNKINALSDDGYTTSILAGQGGYIYFPPTIPSTLPGGDYDFAGQLEVNGSYQNADIHFTVNNAGNYPPAPPSNVGISSATQNSITLTWSDNSNNEDGFKIYRWNGSSYVYLNSVGANTTSYYDSGLSCGTDYFYGVSAYNSYGESTQFYGDGYTSNCSQATATPSSSVTLDRILTTDANWNAKTTFYPGDVLGLAIYGSNNTSSDASITLSWNVYDPNGVFVNEFSNQNYAATVSPGSWGWAIQPTISSSAVGGTYTFNAVMAYNGSTSQLTTQFVIAGAATPTPLSQATSTPDNCGHFNDVPTNYPFYQYIHDLACAGVVNGTGNGNFSPDATATRDQFSKMVVLGFGLPIRTPVSGASFSDVPRTYWAWPYIETAYAYHVVNGIGNGVFAPQMTLSRSQIVAMVVRARGWTLQNPSNPDFSDVPTSYWAYSYIETAYIHGAINGAGGGLFLPDMLVPRSQLAKILYNGIHLPLDGQHPNMPMPPTPIKLHPSPKPDGSRMSQPTPTAIHQGSDKPMTVPQQEQGKPTLRPVIVLRKHSG